MDVDAGQGSDGASRQLSTIAFPYLDLDEAIVLAKAIFTNAGSECSVDQLAAYLGHATTDSGGFRLKISTARVFGVVETQRDNVRLTTLGFEIVEPAREKSARAAAFLNVPLYKATFDRFRGRQLPPDGALERVFADMGVAQKQVAKARQAFQRSAEQAGFFGAGRDRLVEPAGRVVPDDAPSPIASAMPGPARADTVMSGLPELIAAMVKQLPPDGSGFPRERRAKWLATLENVLELVYGQEDY
jgi:hypothetical protein